MAKSKIIHVLLICFHCTTTLEDFRIIIKAFTPKGLKVSIADQNAIKFFAFHGKINETLEEVEPGAIASEISRCKNGEFTFFDPDAQLNIGDVLHYWVFIQQDSKGYKMIGEKLIDSLLHLNHTSLNSSKPLEDKTLIHYKFNLIDKDVWTVEQYIPKSPDYPFNIYLTNNTSVDNDGLHISPKYVPDNAKHYLDLSMGCTRSNNSCYQDYKTILNPPITSGQIRLKTPFCFREVIVKAKLPKGDYVYPQIYLDSTTNPEIRIVIAYSRGNNNYEKDRQDIGGRTVFAGPVKVTPTKLTEYPFNFTHNAHVGDDWHVYKLIWSKKGIQLYFDDILYAFDETIYKSFNLDQCHLVNYTVNVVISMTFQMQLVLGVGAAGPTEFPDEFQSSGVTKPYRSKSRNAIKDFMSKSASWLSTWSDESTQLQVEEVIIKDV